MRCSVVHVAYHDFSSRQSCFVFNIYFDSASLQLQDGGCLYDDEIRQILVKTRKHIGNIRKGQFHMIQSAK